MSADNMLATPRPGTLGDRLARVAEDLECQVEQLLDLVVRANEIITEVAQDYTDWVPAETWLDDAAPIIGEAT